MEIVPRNWNKGECYFKNRLKIGIRMKFTTSDTAIEAIKGFEGLRLNAYKCPAGIVTIGYGSTGRAKMGDTITEEQADSYLREDLAVCEKYVNSEDVCKRQGQFDALVDFCFNLGCGQLGKSTLLKYIHEGRSDEEIQAQFRRWCYSNGKKLPGLVKRCEWRAKRWVEE